MNVQIGLQAPTDMFQQVLYQLEIQVGERLCMQQDLITMVLYLLERYVYQIFISLYILVSSESVKAWESRELE